MNRTVLSLALAAGIAALTGSAWAGQCVKAAAGDFKDCKAGCKEDFQTAKDA